MRVFVEPELIVLLVSEAIQFALSGSVLRGEICEPLRTFCYLGLRQKPENLSEPRIVAITDRRIAIGPNPFGMLLPQRVMHLPLKRGICGNFTDQQRIDRLHVLSRALLAWIECAIPSAFEIEDRHVKREPRIVFLLSKAQTTAPITI